MENQQIANSQFADTCRIPRPTLSQLLNGRNKKISDELIGKIHEAFPALSVLWLMFGEGDMMIDENIEISEPQRDIKTDIPDERRVDFKDIAHSCNQMQGAFEIESNKFSQTKAAKTSTYQNESIEVNADVQHLTAPVNSTKVSINTDCNKKITNIVVFYSDNSFQSFAPSD